MSFEVIQKLLVGNNDRQWSYQTNNSTGNLENAKANAIMQNTIMQNENNKYVNRKQKIEQFGQAAGLDAAQIAILQTRMKIFQTVEIGKIQDEINAFVISNESDLDNFRIDFVGRKGRLASLFDQLKNVPAEARREVGQSLNGLKNLAESKKILLTEVYAGTTQEVADQNAVRINKIALIDIYTAYSYSILVDTFGNVPYTEALDIENHPNPK